MKNENVWIVLDSCYVLRDFQTCARSNLPYVFDNLLDEIHLYDVSKSFRFECTSTHSIKYVRNTLVLIIEKWKCLNCSWLLLCFERISNMCLMKSTYTISCFHYSSYTTCVKLPSIRCINVFLNAHRYPLVLLLKCLGPNHH